MLSEMGQVLSAYHSQIRGEPLFIVGGGGGLKQKWIKEM